MIAVALAAAVWLTVPAAPEPRAAAQARRVSDAEVLGIVETHCGACHLQRPTHPAFKAPPKNVVLETADDLRRYASLIDLQTVRTRTMPLGNTTGMTDGERTRLGAWLAAQPK